MEFISHLFLFLPFFSLPFKFYAVCFDMLSKREGVVPQLPGVLEFYRCKFVLWHNDVLFFILFLIICNSLFAYCISAEH